MMIANVASFVLAGVACAGAAAFLLILLFVDPSKRHWHIKMPW